ncbi:MAG: hypothetical protein AB7D41_03550 [Arcobacter sp.]|uniref:hypothetical protein n=1 Tax=Arcobacter sp. TaxID=1872629 RepID=UPI003D076CFD
MAILSAKFFEKADSKFPDLNIHEINALHWTVVHAEGKMSFIDNKELINDENNLDAMNKVYEIYKENYDEMSKFKNDETILRSHLEKKLGLREDTIVPNYSFELNDDDISRYAKEFVDNNNLELIEDYAPQLFFIVRKEIEANNFDTLKDATYHTLEKFRRGYTKVRN